MGKIGIAMVGWAHGHVHAYVHMIKGFDDAQVVTSWDHDRARLESTANALGVACEPDLDKVLSSKAVDLVIIGSETCYHPELVEAAARAGKDIIVQKPMAFDRPGCDRIIAAVDKAGVFFSVAYQMRYDPANRKMKELMEAGAIGRVGIVRRRHCIGVLLNKDFVNGGSRWHILPETNKGMFMDDASHPADMFYWWFGMPASVTAEIANVLTDVSNDDTGVAIYRWPSGVLGYIFNSSVVLAGENTTEIYGDRGVILQNYGDGPSCDAVARPAGAVAVRMFQPQNAAAGWQDMGVPIPTGGHGDRIRAVARHILDEYKAGKPQVDARAGKGSVDMVLGAYQSSEAGRRVTFPLG